MMPTSQTTYVITVTQWGSCYENLLLPKYEHPFKNQNMKTNYNSIGTTLAIANAY